MPVVKNMSDVLPVGETDQLMKVPAIYVTSKGRDVINTALFAFAFIERMGIKEFILLILSMVVAILLTYLGIQQL